MQQKERPQTDGEATKKQQQQEEPQTDSETLMKQQQEKKNLKQQLKC